MTMHEEDKPGQLKAILVPSEFHSTHWVELLCWSNVVTLLALSNPWNLAEKRDYSYTLLKFLNSLHSICIGRTANLNDFNEFFAIPHVSAGTPFAYN